MNMRIPRQPFPYWIVDDVQNLITEILFARHAMRVVPLLPNLPCHLFANGKRKASLNELCAFFYRYVRHGCENSVKVIRHNDKSMEFNLPASR